MTTASEYQNLALDDQAYVDLLGKLISVSKHLQNAPSLNLIPEEDLAGNFVLQRLKPYMVEQGGILHVERHAFQPNRGNLIIKILGSAEVDEADKPTIAFIGSHMDVVPANPEDWTVDPFKMSIDGDKLYGRGTTDCLGHVALVTELFVELAKANVRPARTIAAVLIVSEENTEIPEVGVDHLMAQGKLDFLKNGPVIWIDCADSEPCMGTAGVVTWTLEAKGKLFHSGLPYQGINALELGMDAITKIQSRFYQDFPPHEKEKEYNFMCSSTMKPTTVESSVNSLNQIPPWVKISGDIRLAPFYNMSDVQAKVETYVAEINQDLESLEGLRGPHSKYVLDTDERGQIQFSFGDHFLEGIACSTDSIGHHALVEATKRVRGSAKPYSIMGSLPLVKDLQRNGFDVQLIGFGLSTVYHGVNEYCLLSDMQQALKVLATLISIIEEEK